MESRGQVRCEEYWGGEGGLGSVVGGGPVWGGLWWGVGGGGVVGFCSRSALMRAARSSRGCVCAGASSHPGRR